jgi:hypothetical protein
MTPQTQFKILNLFLAISGLTIIFLVGLSGCGTDPSLVVPVYTPVAGQKGEEGPEGQAGSQGAQGPQGDTGPAALGAVSRMWSDDQGVRRLTLQFLRLRISSTTHWATASHTLSPKETFVLPNRVFAIFGQSGPAGQNVFLLFNSNDYMAGRTSCRYATTGPNSAEYILVECREGHASDSNAMNISMYTTGFVYLTPTTITNVTKVTMRVDGGNSNAESKIIVQGTLTVVP